MPVMLLFSAKPYKLEARAVTKAISDAFALTSNPWADGQHLKSFPPAEDGAQKGSLWVNLPELEDDEGQPVVHLSVEPRLDRDDSLQQLINEIIGQEAGLKEALDRNASDLIIEFDDTPAGFEAACMVAYVLSEETASGILVPAFDEGEEMLWYDTAEDFANEIFQDDDDEFEDDGEWQDEEDDEDQK
jgi:hypothetical protein